MKSIIGSVTTTFVGNYYETDGATVTKYYGVYPAASGAGSQRIAMSVNGTVAYLLSDQLGSTSITANGNGGLISELRYKAWGEVRYSYQTTPTDYTYTGQYSNVADFGLMYYNARWYDPALGRMAQADSIVPGGVQGYDRYAYANNNPMRYSDPSGHYVCEGTDACTAGDSGDGSNSRSEILKRHLRDRFGFSVQGNWTVQQLGGIYSFLDDKPISTFMRDLPGSSDRWSGAATGLDMLAWLIDAYDAGVVTAGGVMGAGIPAALLPEGVPEVPVVTGLAGMGIAELYVQVPMRIANGLALISTALTVVADTKAGTTTLENGIIGPRVANSAVTTAAGFAVPEAYTSLVGQSIAVTNDLGWTSLPFSGWGH